jgi:hypothetical protein
MDFLFRFGFNGLDKLNPVVLRLIANTRFGTVTCQAISAAVAEILGAYRLGLLDA